jgi:hypothetical protein
MAKNTQNQSTSTRTVNVTKGKQGFQETEKAAPASPFDALTPDRTADLMDQAVRVAEKWSRRRGMVDSESINDVASEAIAQLLDAVKKRGGLMENPEGYLTTVVKNESASASATVSKSARAGFSALNKRVDTIEQQLGRSLTNEELDAEGNAILAQWPDQAHKPPKNFWKKGSTRAIASMSFSEPDADHGIRGSVFGDDNGQRIDESIVFNDALDGNRWSSSLLRIAEDGRSNEGTIFRYNAHAEVLGAPMAIPGSMTRRAHDNARNAVDVAGGVDKKSLPEAERNKAMNEGFLNVVRAWEDGEETDATEALFKPFGKETTLRQRQAVVGALMVRPDSAHDLWKSALGAANRSNYDRIMALLGDSDGQK